MLRICQRNGWTVQQWYGLDDRERIEWLAHDAYRQRVIRDMLGSMKRKDGAIIDAAAFVHLWLETL